MGKPIIIDCMIRVVERNGKEHLIEGPKEVRAILRKLNILENTVLVVKGDELLTPDRMVEDGATIELIPVISGGMKCRVCGQTAVIAIPRHNAAFCKDHFLEFFKNQVTRAIKEHGMFRKKDRILVCVSGGKDSLVLWYVLTELGYNTTGLYINLGINDYSTTSKQKALKASEALKRELIIKEFHLEYGSIKAVARRGGRSDCSACGTVKRHYFNKVAIDEGFDVVATGHNLDDEAARLLGNLLRWQWEYLGRVTPVLEEARGLKKKVKPLCRLTEHEIATYAFLKGIDYIVEECPMSRHSTSLLYKEALNRIELQSPGTKHYFYQEYLRTGRKVFQDRLGTPVGVCSSCGMPTTERECSFCRLISRYLDSVKRPAATGSQ